MDVSSTELGIVRFHQIPLDDLATHYNFVDNGRPAYISAVKDSPIYLYHVLTEDPLLGIGKWMISNTLGETDIAMAYIRSWAVAPFLINDVIDSTPSSSWMIPSVSNDDDNWEADSSLTITCVDTDRTIYFEGSPLYQSSLAGFYMQRIVSDSHSYKGSVHSHVKPLGPSPGEPQLYLYRVPGTNSWLVGDRVGVDAGTAFVRDSAVFADEIASRAWHFISAQDDNRWVPDESTAVYRGDPRGSVYSAMRSARAVKRPPYGMGYKVLRGNGLPMPVVGLGTGGLYHEELPDLLRSAVTMGYRLLDLAREYGNEHIVGQVMAASRPLVRHALFLQTKVWPTELGAGPTARAVRASLLDLGSSYADQYMLHWPR